MRVVHIILFALDRSHFVNKKNMQMNTDIRSPKCQKCEYFGETLPLEQAIGGAVNYRLQTIKQLFIILLVLREIVGEHICTTHQS